MHYYQFHIGDYQSDTRHLELMEDLAYRRMLDLYYKTENPLPLDVEEIARLVGMRSHSDCIEIVLKDFFERTDEGWRNNKADEVLAATYSKSEKARRSAKARWAKKPKEKQEDNANAMRTHSEGNADGMLPNTQYPIPNTHSKTHTSPAKPDDKAVRKRQAIELMNLWNQAKKEHGINWTAVDDPEHTSAKRYTRAAARAEYVRQRLKRNDKPNEWDDIKAWFTKFYSNLANDPFYSGMPTEQRPNGYKATFEQVHAEEYFIKAIERLTQGWMS